MQQDTRSIPFPASRRAVTTGRLQRLFPAARMLAGLSRSLAGKPFPPFDVTLEDGTVHRFRPDETIRGDTVVGRPAGTPGASESTRIPGRAAGMTGLAETAGADNIPTSSARPPCRASDDPAFTLRIRNRDGLRALASLDELSIAEAYVGGNIDVEGEFLPVLDMRRFFSDRHPMQVDLALPGNHTAVCMLDLIAAGNEAPFELIAAQNDRHSYFLTLRDWARNFEAAHDELSCRFGEATYRLFRLYLWATAHCLHRDGSLESYRVVFQHAAGRESGEIGL